jgi:hypothetical protein
VREGNSTQLNLVSCDNDNTDPSLNKLENKTGKESQGITRDRANSVMTKDLVTKQEGVSKATCLGGCDTYALWYGY